MEEHTKQEQFFLERLGITPGPWKKTYQPGKSPDIVWNNTNLDFVIAKVEKREENNSSLIAKSPEMFLRLWKIACSWYINDVIDNEAIKIIECATNKTWQELCKLWEECNGIQ